MPSKQTMEELAAAAAELNSASDDLNEIIETFEDQLQRAGVGVSCWLGEEDFEPSAWLLPQAPSVEDPDDDNHLVATGWLLGYVKLSDKWRLAVKEVLVNIYPRADLQERENKRDLRKPDVPLLKAPRHIRVAAAAQFEELAKLLTRRMKQHTADIEEAKALVGEKPNGEAGSRGLADREWDDKWRVCVVQCSANVHGVNFAGSPREYVEHMQWGLLKVNPDGMVLARNRQQEQIAIGRSPDGPNALLLVKYK